MHFAPFSILIGCSLLAQTDIILNGSFENAPPLPPGQTQTTATGTQIPNWFIPFADVDVNGPFWSPSDGLRSVDLHGINIGAIEQVVPTLPGASYRIVFDLGATGQTASAQVQADAQLSPVFQHVGGGFPQVTYALDQSWTFVAMSTSTTIRFTSLSTSSAANGPHIDHVRVFEYPSARFSIFGTGCLGSNGLPFLSAQAGPTLGQQFTVDVANVPQIFTLVFGVVGFSSSVQSGQPLPLDLTGLGMPGCSQFVAADSVFPVLTTGSHAAWAMGIPADPFFAGFHLYAQAFVPDFGANPLGATVSNAGDGQIGF